MNIQGVQPKFNNNNYPTVLRQQAVNKPHMAVKTTYNNMNGQIMTAGNLWQNIPAHSPVSSTPVRNYSIFDQNKVDYFVKQKEQALPYLSDILQHSNNEEQITETLYIVDRMIEGGTKGVDKMYPVLSRFNQTNSPYIQTFLAGIYRKIQVPDAFGPLLAMLIRNSVNPPQANFDPNEEVGGALLSYLSDRFRQ